LTFLYKTYVNVVSEDLWSEKIAIHVLFPFSKIENRLAYFKLEIESVGKISVLVFVVDSLFGSQNTRAKQKTIKKDLSKNFICQS